MEAVEKEESRKVEIDELNFQPSPSTASLPLCLYLLFQTSTSRCLVAGTISLLNYRSLSSWTTSSSKLPEVNGQATKESLWSVPSSSFFFDVAPFQLKRPAMQTQSDSTRADSAVFCYRYANLSKASPPREKSALPFVFSSLVVLLPSFLRLAKLIPVPSLQSQSSLLTISLASLRPTRNSSLESAQPCLHPTSEAIPGPNSSTRSLPTLSSLVGLERTRRSRPSWPRRSPRCSSNHPSRWTSQNGLVSCFTRHQSSLQRLLTPGPFKSSPRTFQRIPFIPYESCRASPLSSSIRSSPFLPLPLLRQLLLPSQRLIASSSPPAWNKSDTSCPPSSRAATSTWKEKEARRSKVV